MKIKTSTVVRAVYLGTTIASCGIAIANHRKVVKTERGKRRQIKQNTAQELSAIAQAGLAVNQKIARGDYRLETDLPRKIRDDMEFFKMIALIES